MADEPITKPQGGSEDSTGGSNIPDKDAGAQAAAAEAAAIKAAEAKDKEAQEASEEAEKVEEIFEMKSEPKTWIVGKPPELGGKENQWSRYVQKPLGFMPRMRFFSLVTNTISEAVKAGGAVDMGFGDVFGPDGGSMRERGQKLMSQDFSDAGSFMALAFKLLAYSPDFLLDCYVLWLDVPPGERAWAKLVMDQPYDEESEKWGLKEDDGLEMIEIFIDQNYEEIRDFFVEKLPKFVARVQQREQGRAARESS